MKYNIYIGIDPGINTGIAVYNKSEKSLKLATLKIHRAMESVKGIFDDNNGVIVRFEDARQRNWFGKAGREQLQGAGSIKRDCKIWEDWLKDKEIPFEMVAPKNNRTKLGAEQFAKLTGYSGRSSEHSRDAAMLVFGY